VYPGLGAAPGRRSGAWLVVVLGGLVFVNLYVFVWDKHTGVAAIRDQAAHAAPAMALPTVPISPPVATDAGLAAVPAVAAPPAIEGKVGRSDTLGKLLKKNGLTAAEADEVIRALSGVLDFKTIRAGQTYRISRGSGGRVMEFELEVGKGHRVRAERRPSGELVASQLLP
jgi:hypothetical protein